MAPNPKIRAQTPTPQSEPVQNIPDWYRDIHPSGECDGFYEKIGGHALCYVERSKKQLVITFDNLSTAGYKGYDRQAWGSKFCADNGWSCLGVLAPGPTWYRDARLIERMERLRDEKFFDQFENVALAGASMGGYAAMAFSQLIPGANVIAFSPQTTLDREIVPWETRFKQALGTDWTLPYKDAVDCISTANTVYVIYDQFIRLDKKHALRLTGDNVVLLRAPGCGHRTPFVLRRLKQLKPTMYGGITGSLTQTGFADMIKGRGHIWQYRKVCQVHLQDRGLDHWIPKLEAVYKHRRKLHKKAARALGA